MKDEIKEILAYFEEYVKITDMHDSEPMLNWKDLKIVLDYITNLRQIEQDHQKLNGELREENQRLKETIENLTTMTVCGDRKQIKNTAQYKLEIYKSRTEKAVDYIKCGLTGDIENDRAYIDENALLDILNGRSDE